MTLKTLHVGGISILALSLIAMPGMAMAASKAKNKTKKIECNVSVEDGEVTIEKTINGKVVKADEEDKDCNARMNLEQGISGLMNFNVNVDESSDGRKHVRVMTMGGGSLTPFLSYDDEVLGAMNIIIRDDDKTGGKTMRWFSKGGPGFGGMGFGKQLHMMGGNGFQLMMVGDDNEELDLNKDGTVTQAEARKARDEKLKPYDSNRDGMLSLDEYQGYWLSKRHAKMVDDFQDLDEDGDALITGEEFSSSAVKSARVRGKMQKMMAEHKAKSVSKHKKKRK